MSVKFDFCRAVIPNEIFKEEVGRYVGCSSHVSCLIFLPTGLKIQHESFNNTILFFCDIIKNSVTQYKIKMKGCGWNNFIFKFCSILQMSVIIEVVYQ